MATIDSKEIIKEMIECGGSYRGDPAPIAIYQYKTPEGKRTWSVCYMHIDVTNVMQSPFVRAPIPIWDHEEGWLLPITIEEYFNDEQPNP